MTAPTICDCGRAMVAGLRYGRTPEPVAVSICLHCGRETDPLPCCLRRRRPALHPITLEEKRCTLGDHLAPLEAFAPDAAQRTGVRSACRACTNERRNERRARKTTKRERLLDALAEGPATVAALAARIYGASDYAEREAVHELIYVARRAGWRIERVAPSHGRAGAYRLIVSEEGAA